MFTLLILGMLTWAFNIRLVKAETYYYDFGMTVTPESPTVYDEVNVIVGFSLSCINYIVNFSTLLQSGNDFFTIVDIYIPLICLPVACDRGETYHLGKLAAGSYLFNVDVQVWDNETGLLLELDSYRKSFAVTSIPVGGYSFPIKGNTTTMPSTLYLAIIAISTSVFAIIKRKTHRRTKQSRRP